MPNTKRKNTMSKKLADIAKKCECTNINAFSDTDKPIKARHAYANNTFRTDIDPTKIMQCMGDNTEDRIQALMHYINSTSDEQPIPKTQQPETKSKRSKPNSQKPAANSYLFPENTKSEIKRIAALQIDDEEVKILRDRILIGYTYFLSPKHYMNLRKSMSEEYLMYAIFFNKQHTMGIMRQMPIHPLVNQILEEYGGTLPSVKGNNFDVFPLYSQLFPDAKKCAASRFAVRMKNFSLPRKAMLCETIEGLSFREHAILAGYHEKESGQNINELFDHPFFEPLRIRLNK